jgi:oxalate decarboxylase/phosphoglucose isomerase-like protein (cupin superfamily)
MPGFEIEYIITGDTVPDNDRAIFGHCIFPPRSAHCKHQHLNACEVVYTIKGIVVNGYTTKDGDVENVCPAGTAAFAPVGAIHWTRNPFDEPAEFVFAYYGASSIKESGYVDLRPEFEGEK